ncbi:MAG: DMT family transporter [Actinomycetota bacterium]|nr:DMT family transporter [Actinomycetota bacterium]
MLGVLLALSSSFMWGFADYLGGLQTRSRQVLSVVLISQAAGFVVIATIVVLRGVGWPGAQAMLPAAVAGVMGALCIVTFYLALSYGPVSIVAPVLASSACIPVVYGLARGERPSALQLAGLAATLVGVMLVSWSDDDDDARGRRGIGFGVIAAVLLGTLLVFFSRASAVDPYWAPFVLRAVSMSTVGAFIVVRGFVPRVDGRGLAVIASIGVLDVLANLAYSVSTTLQLLSITAVLSSLFPVVTVALARIHLGERVTRVQGTGSVITMLGVLLVAAG